MPISCLMGKFRNGELADDSIGLSVDLEIFALHYEMPLGRTLSLSRGQKGPLPGCRGTMASMASRRRHIQISGILGVRSFRIPCVARSAILQRSYLARPCGYREQTAD